MICRSEAFQPLRRFFSKENEQDEHREELEQDAGVSLCGVIPIELEQLGSEGFYAASGLGIRWWRDGVAPS